MLDVADPTELGPVDWESIASRAETPRDLEGFFDRSGPKPTRHDERRVNARFYLRQRVVLAIEGEPHAGYLCDLSRCGVGLVSPVQLFPRDRFRLWLPGRDPLNLEALRCLREDVRCYHVGAVFVGGGVGTPVERLK